MALNIVSVKKQSGAGKFTVPDSAQRILVVGNGMASARFCQELVRLGVTSKFKVTVVGDEGVAAYNRIKLGEYIDHEEIGKLILEDESWYAENAIDLQLGVRVDKIEAEEKCVRLSNGEKVEYDLMVMATGSRPTVPDMPGIDHPKVFTYRNLADLQRIIEKFRTADHVAIMGGGLLGIEAAHSFQKIGVGATIIQRANFLMTKQLNMDAAKVLEKKIEGCGIKVVKKVTQAAIASAGDQIKIKLNKDGELVVDYLVVSAGITPNTEIAEEAGIECGLHGGCIVDHHLRTSDPSVFAIGECALLDGRLYGLAAPGFEMATQLAELLSGNVKRKLNELDNSTRLKMNNVDVSVIGSPVEQGQQYIYQSDDVYRMVTLDRKRRVVGAMGVGNWDDYAELHDIYLSKTKFRKKQLDDFLEKGSFFPDSDVVNPLGWSDTRIICNCMSIKKGLILDAISKYGSDPAVIAEQTKASTVCGSCEYLVKGLCGETVVIGNGGRVPKLMLISSIVAFVIVALSFLLPPAPIADSVTSVWAKVDRLWRDNLLKQITGYTMLAVFTLGLLVSARKRLTWFKFGKYGSWRYFHVAFGVLSLVILYAHTGFYFGYNLNFWLMFCFTLLNLLGAITGIVIALESTKNEAIAKFAQRVRPYAIWGHIVLFWPLPILVGFHILSAYQY